MNPLPEQIIVDILSTEMTMPTDSVWVRDQNRLIPNDNGLYMAVGFVDGTPISNVTTPVENDDGTLSEVQQIVARENIQIDIFSADNQAVLRRWEVLQAIKSIYSQQSQERNSFRIFSIPTNFVNTSGVEGPKNINRFTLVIVVHSWYRKEKLISSKYGDFYDDFGTRVDDAVTIGQPEGLIEFEIPENAVHASVTVNQAANTITATATNA